MLDRCNLHDYQLRTIEHIIKNPYAGVILDMGLGKTVSTLTAVDSLAYDYCEIDRVLVIAPKRVAESSWSNEIKQWKHLKDMKMSLIVGTQKQRAEALRRKALVYVISRDNLGWLRDELTTMKKQDYFDMLVLDELSSFKNSSTERFKACKFLRAKAKRCVGLTGTLMPNGYKDLFAQIYLLDGGNALGRFKTKFMEQYFVPTARNGATIYDWKLRQGAEEILQAKLKPFCISMRKEDYLSLAKSIVIDYFVELSPKEYKEYKELERSAVLSIEGAELTTTNAASLSNALCQLAGGAIYTDASDELINGKRPFIEVHKAKIDALKELVENADSPVLIAYNYKHEKERIIEALKEYKPLEFATAKDVEEWNSGKRAVAIGHPASIGHGLNLQRGGSIIVWYSLTWSLELYQQFNARLDRQGQSRSVRIYHLLTKYTIDEKISKALQGKGEMQNQMMNALKEISENAK